MTLEQKQLLSEIQRRYKQGETAWHLNDIALLLSLVKSQEADSEALMGTYTTILDEDVVARIEFANARYRTDWRYPNQRKHIDALCREWRALRAEIAKLTTLWCECGHTKDKHAFFSDHDECYECDQASPDLCCEWRPALLLP